MIDNVQANAQMNVIATAEINPTTVNVTAFSFVVICVCLNVINYFFFLAPTPIPSYFNKLLHKYCCNFIIEGASFTALLIAR